VNSEKINNWLTTVANVGVVIGLIFLVVELRQANHQADAATSLQRASDIEIQFKEFALSNELATIYVKFGEEG
jgi:hypothetical protein